MLQKFILTYMGLPFLKKGVCSSHSPHTLHKFLLLNFPMSDYKMNITAANIMEKAVEILIAYDKLFIGHIVLEYTSRNRIKRLPQ